MASKRLYQGDFYLKSNVAKITKVENQDGFDAITCDESVFFPEGGGQPSDIGTVSKGDVVYNITSASDDGLDTDVVHLTDAPTGTFKVGDEVILTIDWDFRFRNMQRHLGEHMLSGTFHTLFGGVNKGFHMSDDYIAIDIDLGGEMLSDEEIDLAEKTVNDAIWADLPVQVEYFENYEASLVRPVRKAVPHDGEVSVVTVGDIENPYDCIACCGTHPDSSSQVGLIAIYKHEPNKGMNRIYFDCGISAKEYLSKNYKLLTEIANRNSCSNEDLLHKLEANEAANTELKNQMAKMSAYIKDTEKSKILDAFGSNNSCIYELDLLSVDDLLKLGFACMEGTADKFLILLHPEQKTALLFSSGDAKCGELVKANASQFNGRGGGRDDNARAVFESEKDLRTFANDIIKMI